MSWIILCGIDRSGKSSVAELYKSQNYEVVHMSAPDKKYEQPGYSGPSYLDDIVDILMLYDGKDVVWDRSWYGELVWPHVYGRKPLLTDEDIEILREFEDRNNTQRVLMIDPDQGAHWQRCVDNKENLTFPQFRLAATLYSKMAHTYNFGVATLNDFLPKTESVSPTPKINVSLSATSDEITEKPVNTKAEGRSTISTGIVEVSPITSIANLSGIEKLDKANAISAVLSKRVIKQRGGAFEAVEREVQRFLHDQLNTLLGNAASNSDQLSLSPEEVQIIKVFCQRLRDKQTNEQKESAQKLHRGLK